MVHQPLYQIANYLFVFLHYVSLTMTSMSMDVMAVMLVILLHINLDALILFHTIDHHLFYK